MKPAFKVILMAAAYLVTFILGAASGAIHPACYAYIGALLPLVFAFIYLYTWLYDRDACHNGIGRTAQEDLRI